jgi:hypothetical protein
MSNNDRVKFLNHKLILVLKAEKLFTIFVDITELLEPPKYTHSVISIPICLFLPFTLSIPPLVNTYSQKL